MTNKFVTVGMHEDSGLHGDDGITNAQLGATLHYGTDNGNIPPRPFLDVGVASGNQDYLALIADGLEDGLQPDMILEQIGSVAASKVQEYMRDLKTPPNAPSTVERKGANNPLIDTGALRQSVTYKVQATKPSEGIS